MSGSLPLDRYDDVSALFRVLAAPARVAIVHLLAARQLHARDLVEETGMTQPLVSQHLRVLREAGVVRRVRAVTGMPYGLRTNTRPASSPPR